MKKYFMFLIVLLNTFLSGQITEFYAQTEVVRKNTHLNFEQISKQKTQYFNSEFQERIGMIEMTPWDSNWIFRGYSQFNSPLLNPVDPSAMWDNGLLVFYFFDLQSLGTDTAVVYRCAAIDSTGLNFTMPEVAFKYYGDITDPFTIRLPNGSYRMYLHGSSAEGIISASSTNGHIFNLDNGIRATAGGVPGALVLPDGKIRLFVCSQGITSLLSDDGLNFTPEPGVRILIPSGAFKVADPNPIQCIDGIYRMAYKVKPIETESPEYDEVYLAESADGFTWTSGLLPIIKGSVPTLVELPNGTLRIYYVDFTKNEQSGLFKFIKTIQVTPDNDFQTGSFARINYIPATDRFVVTFGTKKGIIPGTGKGAGYAYKEYTKDFVETGNTGTFTWNSDADEAQDSGSDMIDNTYYFVHVPFDTTDFYGWKITKYDAVSWKPLSVIYVPLEYPYEKNNDPMVAYVNGLLDISSQYDASGTPPPLLEEGAATHHHFFTTDLQPSGDKILSDTPHVCGSSMIYLNGIYYFVTADAFLGDLVVMKYDTNWNYLGLKKLIPEAHWSQGIVYNDQRFYVSYLNTSQRTPPSGFPVYLNAHLAAFDMEWNLLDDVAVTNYTPQDNRQPGRPWIILQDNKLYVSYDCDTINTMTGELLRWQAYVSIYELLQYPNSIEPVKNMFKIFQLEQNYPNPFNPTTKIRFRITEHGFVSLKVFDLLGKEISTLINEEKPAGTYEVTWNAANLPSGIYFYQLRAGSYTATKKLLLLK
jgi:hypothetical protein